MNELQTKFPDTWVCNSWDEYVRLLNSHTKSQGLLLQWTTANWNVPCRIWPRQRSHDFIFAVNLFATLKGIPLNGRDNCTYRKAGVQECQPDLLLHWRQARWFLGNYDCKLDHYPTKLGSEVANTSLADDIGQNVCYEDLRVDEYWVVDVQNTQVIAFAIIADSGSRHYSVSGVVRISHFFTRKHYGEVARWIKRRWELGCCPISKNNSW